MDNDVAREAEEAWANWQKDSHRYVARLYWLAGEISWETYQACLRSIDGAPMSDSSASSNTIVVRLPPERPMFGRLGLGGG